MLYVIAFVLVAIYCFPIHRLKICGKENIPANAAIFAANHTCWSDPIFLALGLGIKNRPQFMTKIEVVRGKFFGKFISFFLRKLGVFFVDRQNSSLAAIKYSMSALKKGKKLIIFPEGTRVKEGAHVEPKGGTIMIAHKAGVPVVPVYITAGKKRPFSKVKVIFGTPVNYDHLGKRPDSAEYEECAEKLMERIFELENE